jgi:nitric oxide synthase-interacting protein
MGKHAKNNSAAPVFTYAERRSLKIWGNQQVRTGADSIKDFDACSLCLHGAVDPLTCPKGHLFCKACIYEHLLNQKQFIKKQTVKYDKQQTAANASTDVNVIDKAAHAKRLQQFDAAEQSILPQHVHTNKANKKAVPAGYTRITGSHGEELFVVDKDKTHELSSTTGLSKGQLEEKKKILPSYWVPSHTPQAQAEKVGKPNAHTMCPEGGHILRLKALRPVHFQLSESAATTAAKADAAAAAASTSASSSSSSSKKKSATEQKHDDSHSHTNKATKPASTSAPVSSAIALNASKSGRYMCPSCRRGLSNIMRACCIVTCGHVLCRECCDRFVVKDQHCTHCSAKCVAKDIVELALGGTGFAAHGASTVVAKTSPAFQCG